MSTEPVSLTVLAGGAGSRMGRPKGDLVVAGRPILAYLLDRFAWDGPTLLVTAPGREHPPGWERFDREAVDPVADLGPLRGVLTALESSTTDRIIVTTVDMPGVTGDGLRWLASLECDLGVMTCHDGRVEPLPAVFSRRAVDLISAALNADQRSVHRLSECEGFTVVPAPTQWDQTFWTNLNTVDDLASCDSDVVLPPSRF